MIPVSNINTNNLKFIKPSIIPPTIHPKSHQLKHQSFIFKEYPSRKSLPTPLIPTNICNHQVSNLVSIKIMISPTAITDIAVISISRNIVFLESVILHVLLYFITVKSHFVVGWV